MDEEIYVMIYVNLRDSSHLFQSIRNHKKYDKLSVAALENNVFVWIHVNVMVVVGRR